MTTVSSNWTVARQVEGIVEKYCQGAVGPEIWLREPATSLLGKEKTTSQSSSINAKSLQISANAGTSVLRFLPVNIRPQRRGNRDPRHSSTTRALSKKTLVTDMKSMMFSEILSYQHSSLICNLSRYRTLK